jgi:UDP-N-acetyl-2-amino-2-deoxyglucuronate dehydrogenase
MINVAIIGCGGIASSHIRGFLNFPDKCRIKALVDIYPEKARKLRDEFGLDATVAESYKDLLDSGEIGLVSICTPPFTHAEMSCAFLSAGKDVMVEKPMAASLEECDAMLEAERRSGRILSVIAQNRFKTPIMKLKKTLDSGLIGDVVHVQVDSFWWRGRPYYDLWWRGTWEKEGGGCTLNHAVHHIDMLCWMMGSPAEITAVMGNTSHDNAEVEDISIAVLKYANGALGQITSSVVHHGEEQQLVFQGKAARISAPWKVYASRAKENGFPERNTDLESEILKYYDALPEVPFEGHTGQIYDVLTAIENKTQPLIRGEDGRKTLEIITAIFKSGSTGARVSLPLGKGDPFYSVDGIRKNAIHFHEKGRCVENFPDMDITTGSSYMANK